jgi:hypothetical protein
MPDADMACLLRAVLDEICAEFANRDSDARARCGETA